MATKIKNQEKKKTEIKREKRTVQLKFCKFKEALDCREFLKIVSKRIYVRWARFQLLFLSINKFLKSLLKLHTQWNRTKVIFKSRALVLGVNYWCEELMDNIENDTCGKLFPLKNIIGRFHRKKKHLVT